MRRIITAFFLCMLSACAREPPPAPDQLYRAIFTHNATTVRDLLRRGVDVESPLIMGTDFFTPLTAAVWTGDLKIAAILLAHGADVERTDGCGRTPLMLAAERGACSMIVMLWEAGADTAATQKGTRLTAEQIAVVADQAAAARLLLTLDFAPTR
jgi:uncharacterized protein